MMNPFFLAMQLPVSFSAFLTIVILQPQLSQGTFVSTSIYPNCVETGFPNFSYAKGVIISPGSFPCSGLNTKNVLPPLTITWFYYETYPPPACGNPALPGGDQCCHSTATSTITFYSTTFVNAYQTAVGTSTGNVTAGAFLGNKVTLVLSKNVGNLNCNTTYGQEASLGTASLTIENGPVCPNGGTFGENCPGSH